MAWQIARVGAAADNLDIKLRTCGLRLYRSSSTLGIGPHHDAMDPKVLKAALRQDLARHSVGLSEARMLRFIADGDPPRVPSHNDDVQIDLAQGLPHRPRRRHQGRMAPLEQTSDVRYSLLLEESHPGTAT